MGKLLQHILSEPLQGLKALRCNCPSLFSLAQYHITATAYSIEPFKTNSPITAL